MRERDACSGRAGGERGDSGHDAERYSGIGQHDCLLAAAAVDERVAALQADDLAAFAAERDQEPVHLVLRHSVARQAQSARLGDELGCDQAVVHEDVARADQLQTAGRDQPGVARAGADEPDRHSNASSTSRAK